MEVEKKNNEEERQKIIHLATPNERRREFMQRLSILMLVLVLIVGLVLLTQIVRGQKTSVVTEKFEIPFSTGSSRAE